MAHAQESPAILQDTLVMLNGTTVLATKATVAANGLHYVLPFADTSTTVLPLSQLAYAAYADGRRQSFNKDYDMLTLPPADRYALGVAIGKNRYNGGGAFVAGLVYPTLFGLMITLPVLATRPKMNAWYTGPPAYLTDGAFVQGYQKGLYRKKLKHLGLGAASITGAVLLFAAFNSGG